MFAQTLLHGLTRIRGVRSLMFRNSVEKRSYYGLWPRPHYGYGIFHAADLARRLGLPAISVAEFGVAGGRGLVAMENIAAEISRHTGVGISVFGFDLGSGLPSPVDYRDEPHVYKGGFYQMDEASLRAKLKSATLVLGDVAQSVPKFVEMGGYPPLGFAAFDLDYCTSTVAAFGVFSGADASRLPRVYCYFDDIMWPDLACSNEYIGELCAIREYNLAHERQKICRIYGLHHRLPGAPYWTDQIFVHHDFEHPLYAKYVGGRSDGATELPLR